MAYPTKFSVQRRPKRGLSIGCLAFLGVTAVICGVSALVLVSLLPRLGLQAVGFNPVGEVQTVFEVAPPVPALQIQNPSAPAQVIITTRDYGTVNLDTRQIETQLGEASTGGRVAKVTLSEAQLMDLCHQRTTLCGTLDRRVRNARIDLRPGGAVIYADFFIPQLSIWQPAGIVLTIDSLNAQISVAGVDYQGVLYQVPSGEMQETVSRIAETGNSLLRDAVINTDGVSLKLRELYADDQQLTLVLR